ncbi:MAG TPA: CapA family protein [Acetobacteraceae bacterium]|nr:CapA family protein [Acetobacteraceae bacterium]
MPAQRRSVALRRRELLGAAALASLARRGGAATPLRVAVCGQALIQHDLRTSPWPDFDRIAAIFAGADVAFTDLETAISGPGAGPPTRQGVFTHAAGPEVLDCLKALHVTMLAQSNNHAFDLNAGGILAAIAAMDARGFVHAGTGRTLAEAAAPAYQRTPAGAVALVAMASGQIRDGGAAAETRPGVNEVRRIPGTGAASGLEEVDVARVLAAIGEAARHADLAIVYHHNHLPGPDPGRPPDWQQALAHRCIDAGVAMFVSHGEPLMLGVELYKGQPIFYDLGSLIFQTATEEGHYGAATWQSVIAECRFDGPRFLGATLTPVQMNAIGIGGAADLATRGRPSIATGEDAAAILALLAQLSKPFGTRLRGGEQPGTGEIVL